jgi:hypothetical protein
LVGNIIDSKESSTLFTTNDADGEGLFKDLRGAVAADPLLAGLDFDDDEVA